jgi:PleD family two-component response regulator
MRGSGIDKIILQVAESIVKECRKVYALGRWGTEAFMIIVPRAHLSGVARLTQNAHKILQIESFSWG